MKRIDGFIDILSYYEDFCIEHEICSFPVFETLKELKLAKQSSYAIEQYWFKINNEKYYFKRTNYPYHELIGSEIAKLLGIKAVEYDLAMYAYTKGVISLNYKKRGYKYYSGYELLRSYLLKNKDELLKVGYEELNRYDVDRLNNLEIIWQMLEVKFPEVSHESLVKTLMGIIEQFIFMILTNQYDKGAQNWELELKDNKLDVVPLFDMEDILSETDENTSMFTGVSDIYCNISAILRQFFVKSSQEFIDLFLEKYNLLTEESFLEAIKKVENKINSPIPHDVKTELINNFKLHRQRLKTVINDLGLKNNNGRN